MWQSRRTPISMFGAKPTQAGASKELAENNKPPTLRPRISRRSALKRAADMRREKLEEVDIARLIVTRFRGAIRHC